MTKITSYLLIVCIVALVSCDDLLSDYDSKWIQPEIKDYKSQLCVYASYINGQGLSLSLSGTTSVDGQLKGPSFTSAKVTLEKSNKSILFNDSIKFSNSLNSQNAFIDIKEFRSVPVPADTLIITVAVKGYDMVTGQTTLPAIVNTSKLTAQKYKADEMLYKFILYFDDPKEQSNFYLVSSIYYLTTTTYLGQIPQTYTEAIRHKVPANDPVFDFMPNVRSSTKEPTDMYLFKPRIFNDKVFNGFTYGLKIEIPLQTGTFYHDKKNYSSKYEIELYSISKELFEGSKSCYMNSIISGDIYAEPIILYSNMNNKIGFFGAVNGPSKQMIEIEQNDLLKFGPQE